MGARFLLGAAAFAWASTAGAACAACIAGAITWPWALGIGWLGVHAFCLSLAMLLDARTPAPVGDADITGVGA